MNITGLFIVAALLILLFAGAKFSQKGDWISESFSRTHTKTLQGFCTAGIMLHQLHMALLDNFKYQGSFSYFENAGVLFVGFFFFCSGYGLITSLRTKTEYLKGFLVKRVCTVLVPFFLCNYLYMLVTLLLGTKYTSRDLLTAFFGLKLLNSQMWFAVEIMILYLIFFLAFRFLSKRNEKIGYLVIAVTILCIITAGIFLGHDYNALGTNTWFRGEWWYNTTPLFLLGMLFSRFYSPITAFCKKQYRWLFPLLCFATIIMLHISNAMLQRYGYWTEFDSPVFTVQNYYDKLISFTCQLGAVILFVAVLCICMMKCQFQNKVLTFLGQISLEILLINNVFFQIFDHFHVSIPVYILGSAALTLLSAYVVFRIKEYILEKN